MECCIWVDKGKNWLPRVIEVRCNTISVSGIGESKKTAHGWPIYLKKLLSPEKTFRANKALLVNCCPQRAEQGSCHWLWCQTQAAIWGVVWGEVWRSQGVDEALVHEYTHTGLYWEVKCSLQINREVKVWDAFCIISWLGFIFSWSCSPTFFICLHSREY